MKLVKENYDIVVCDGGRVGFCAVVAVAEIEAELGRGRTK